MKSSLLCFGFLLLVALSWRSANAAVSVGIFRDPAHPGKCVIKPNLILSEGQVAKDPDMTCARITCGRNGEAEFATCGVALPPKGCKFTNYLHADKNYPDCCERRLVCA